jgi:N-methylhydantoinase A/oxoprolinase/acetone carboxylase beta subunit
MIIGLDVGGTHTDVVLLNASGLVRDVKVPTDSANLFDSVLSGLDKITEGIDPKKIKRVVLSTTLTTNAVIQKDFPPVGLIVMAGPGIDPEAYRIGDHYHVVSGVMDHRGREMTPVWPLEVEKIAAALMAEKVRLVGVIGKFSVRNPAHELAVRDILGKHFDNVFLSHEFSGHLNFPRRIATTYLNAAVHPIHKTFFEAVRKSLESKGLQLVIRVLKPDGGNMKMEASIDFPGHTILSGPAASVMGALSHADKKKESLVLDIGGTTTDMAVLVGGVPLLDPLGIEFGGFKTIIRATETYSVGIGGDSHVRVENGELVIGPERVGPSMAFGGTAPTPTDALVVLGRIDDGDREKAARGMAQIASALDTTVEDAALRIFDQTCRNILDAANAMIDRINSKPVYTVHELLEAHQVLPSEVLVLGGPAPHFAEHMATLTDMDVRVVPNWKVANAIGTAMARTTCAVTLFADTQLGTATAPEENFVKTIDQDFDSAAAEKMALSLLEEKATAMGANPDYLDMEVIENMQFNMVRGFYTTGKNIRIKAQVKPGLIRGEHLFAE